MLFKVVESSGLETVVDVTEYNRGEVLEKLLNKCMENQNAIHS